MNTLPPAALQRKLADLLLGHLRRLAEGRPRYGVLDYPWHDNIGDSAIWLGEMPLLSAAHGRPPGHVSMLRFPDGESGRLLGPDGLIYLHGGGNFGDVWPRFQAYREAILERYPGHRIVQLPQSLHYRSPEGIERTKRAIGGHRDFHLMVRDRESFELAQQFDCPVILAPDSAFGIDMAGFPRNGRPEGMKALLRGDIEQRPDAAAAQALFRDVALEDWHGVGTLRRKLNKVTLGGLRATPVRAMMPLRERLFTAMARHRVAMGFAQLDTARVIVTDRLHGHIMSSLLGKPHVVIDNSYGKIRRFIDAWGKDEMTLVAGDYVEARGMADQLLARPISAFNPAS